MGVRPTTRGPVDASTCSCAVRFIPEVVDCRHCHERSIERDVSPDRWLRKSTLLVAGIDLGQRAAAAHSICGNGPSHGSIRRQRCRAVEWHHCRFARSALLAIVIFKSSLTKSLRMAMAENNKKHQMRMTRDLSHIRISASPSYTIWSTLHLSI